MHPTAPSPHFPTGGDCERGTPPEPCTTQTYFLSSKQAKGGCLALPWKSPASLQMGKLRYRVCVIHRACPFSSATPVSADSVLSALHVCTMHRAWLLPPHFQHHVSLPSTRHDCLQLPPPQSVLCPCHAPTLHVLSAVCLPCPKLAGCRLSQPVRTAVCLGHAQSRPILLYLPCPQSQAGCLGHAPSLNQLHPCFSVVQLGHAPLACGAT